MFQLPHACHARFCFRLSFVSLGLFSWAFLFTIFNLAFLVLPFGDMSLCWFSSRLYVYLPMGYGSSLIFYRIRCCGLIGFGLCLFSFLLLSSPGVSPVFISGSAMPKTAFGLYVLVYLLACTQHALGPAWRALTPPSTPMLYGFVDFIFLWQCVIWNWRSLCSVRPYTFVVTRFCAQNFFAALNICIFLLRIISSMLYVPRRIFSIESLLIFIMDSNALRSL